MKKYGLHLAVLIVFVFIAFTTSVSFAQKQCSYEEVLKLMKSGKYEEAEKMLEGTDLCKKQPHIMAVINYQKPGWYEGDLDEIKKYKKPAAELMIELLKSSSPKQNDFRKRPIEHPIKAKFIFALGTMNYKEAVPSIVLFLEDNDVWVRSAAIRALGMINTKEAVRPLYKYLIKEHYLDIDTKNEDTAYNASLLEEEEKGKFTAIAAIVSIGADEIIPDLEKEIASKGSPDRATAAAIYTGLKKESLRDKYIKLIDDGDQNIRIYAASALKDMGDKRGLKQLKEIFNSSKDDKKVFVAGIITQWQDKEAAEFLLDYLKKESTSGKYSFNQLGNIGRVSYINKFSEPKIKLLIDVTNALISWTDITPQLLINIIEKENGNIRYAAVEMLAETLSPLGIPVLRKNLDSDDKLLVYYSLWGLGRLQDKESKDKFIKFLDSPDDHLKLAAEWALLKCGIIEGYKDQAVKLLNSADEALSFSAFDVTCLAFGVVGKNSTYFFGISESELNKSIVKYLHDKKIGEEFNPSLIKGMTIKFLTKEYIPLYEEILNAIAFNSNYAAEALWRITEKNRIYELRWMLPVYEEYSDFNFAQVILLYISMQPEIFGNIRDFNYIKNYSYYHGPVNIPNKNQPLQINGSPNKSSAIIGQIAGEEPVFAKEYRGEYVRILRLNGTSGWIIPKILCEQFSSLEDIYSEIKSAYGLRYKKDVLDFLEENYFSQEKDNFDYYISYTDPAGHELSSCVNAISSLSSTFTPQAGLVLPAEIISQNLDKGLREIYIFRKKTISPDLSADELKKALDSAPFIFKFSPAGELEGIKTKYR